MAKKISRNTFTTENSPSIMSFASIVGEKEGQGPLGSCFDRIEADSHFGQETWEKAESELQKQTVELAMKKASLKPSDIDYIFSGDLINQCIGTTYGLRDLNIPFLGLYGACSTMAEDFCSRRCLQTADLAEKLLRQPLPIFQQQNVSSDFLFPTEDRELPPRSGPVQRPEPLYCPRRETPLTSEQFQ